MVIWPNQQIVIANARNVQAGGEANPDARGRGAAARDGVPAEHDLLVAAARVHGRHVALLRVEHFDLDLAAGNVVRSTSSSALVIIAVLELNALGKISGRGSGGLNVIYETHKNAMYTGFALIVFWYLFAEILLRELGRHTPSASAMRGAVPRARPEELLARLHAPHVEVHVVLPRVADAAVDLDAFLGEQALAVAGRGLGHRRRASRGARSSSAIVSAAK